MITQLRIVFFFTSSKILDGFVVIHDADVDSIEGYEQEGLVPLHILVVHDADKYRDRDAIREAVPGQRPPVQRYHLEDGIHFLA